MIEIKHQQQPKILNSKRSKNSKGRKEKLLLPDININKKDSKEMREIKEFKGSNNSFKVREKSQPLSYLDYQEYENKKLITTYGPQIYEYSRETEHYTCIVKGDDYKGFKLLRNHEITSQIRTKLVDWLFEVLYAYKCEESCMYLTMHLMDTFISKSKTKLTNNDIHLIGVGSLLIASKFEDISPLDVGTLKLKIAHGKFSDKEIKRKERQILEMIDFNVFYTSSYDFIKNFIYDFKYNNRKILSKLKMKSQMELLESTAAYICKVILHSELFSGYKSSLKAISCIIVAFDLVRSNSTAMSTDSESFIHEWINFLIDQSRFEPSVINDVYNEIAKFFNQYDKLTNINHNLKRNAKLGF